MGISWCAILILCWNNMKLQLLSLTIVHFHLFFLCICHSDSALDLQQFSHFKANITLVLFHSGIINGFMLLCDAYTVLCWNNIELQLCFTYFGVPLKVWSLIPFVLAIPWERQLLSGPFYCISRNVDWTWVSTSNRDV